MMLPLLVPTPAYPLFVPATVVAVKFEIYDSASEEGQITVPF
jgi:hypothetical protein